MDRDEIGVIGAGAWGTALAIVAARAGRPVVLWCRSPQQAEALRGARENVRRLPGIALPDAIAVTAEPGRLGASAMILVATPAQALRATMTALAPSLPPGVPTVITAKGIERGTLRLMTEVLAETAPGATPLVLSGPSFAGDVARGLPTAVTLAATSTEIARPVAEALASPTFRPYLSDDLAGVQIGGAVKNVLAIACGIVIGRGLGESARAALVARAFAELSRFGRAHGARAETLAGLSGLGDLVLTASSPQSRNFAFGLALGRTQRIASAGSDQPLSEGAFTASAVVEAAGRAGIDVPICTAVAAILEGRLDIDAAITGLMHRPLKTED